MILKFYTVLMTSDLKIVIRVATKLICFDLKIWNKTISLGLASIMSTR